MWVRVRVYRNVRPRCSCVNLGVSIHVGACTRISQCAPVLCCNVRMYVYYCAQVCVNSISGLRVCLRVVCTCVYLN